MTSVDTLDAKWIGRLQVELRDSESEIPVTQTASARGGLVKLLRQVGVVSLDHSGACARIMRCLRADRSRGLLEKQCFWQLFGGGNAVADGVFGQRRHVVQIELIHDLLAVRIDRFNAHAKR